MTPQNIEKQRSWKRYQHEIRAITKPSDIIICGCRHTFLLALWRVSVSRKSHDLQTDWRMREKAQSFSISQDPERRLARELLELSYDKLRAPHDTKKLKAYTLDEIVERFSSVNGQPVKEVLFEEYIIFKHNEKLRRYPYLIPLAAKWLEYPENDMFSSTKFRSITTERERRFFAF